MTRTPLEKARALRRDSTEAEDILWQCLRNNHLGVKFRRQVPVGPFIADFICHKLNLIIEVDGGQHSESKSDETRTAFLNREGFEVIRFWNNDVTANRQGVVDSIVQRVQDRAKAVE